MQRRKMLRGLAAIPLLSVTPLAFAREVAEKKGDVVVEDLQKNWKMLLAEGADVAPGSEPLALSKEEWHKRLTSQQYHILREEGTEAAGTSALNNEKRPGVYVCGGCALPLFTSEMKFDSGTGWPSFFTTIPDAFGTSRDFKLVWPRTEYHCARCAGHHGHVFKDGPAPTGLRYCNNGVALRFIPKTGKV